MSLIPLDLQPGIYRNGTDFEASNRWRDANLVRWHDGSMRPVGGWSERVATASASAPRGMLAWIDNTSSSNLAIATHAKLHYINASGTVADITPTGLAVGHEDATVNLSYGGDFYGTDNYGIARTSSGIYQEATTWSIDNWGENLLACSSKDGKIYEWTLNTATLPTALSGAPTGNKGMVVTEERFVFALGASSNPRLVAWCDREDNTTWTPLATNEAGDFELQTTGQIMCGLRMRGRTLILTDTDAHIATYSGPPFVYGFERVGTACGIISRKSAVAIDEGAFWMGAKGFFMFDGSVAKEVKCDVIDYIFCDINRNQISKAFAVHNSQFGEIWWFYPSDGAIENDTYVSYDYKEGHWNVGKLERTAGIDRGTFDTPIWADSDADLYNQESGFQHGTLSPFAETGPISLGNGDNLMKVTSLIPDERIQGEVSITFKTRNYPNAAESSHGPYVLTNPTDVRFTGRQIRMRVEGNGLACWRAGTMRIEARIGGKR